MARFNCLQVRAVVFSTKFLLELLDVLWLNDVGFHLVSCVPRPGRSRAFRPPAGEKEEPQWVPRSDPPDPERAHRCKAAELISLTAPALTSWQAEAGSRPPLHALKDEDGRSGT